MVFTIQSHMLAKHVVVEELEEFLYTLKNSPKDVKVHCKFLLSTSEADNDSSSSYCLETAIW